MRYLKNTDLRFHLVEKRARWFIWLAVLSFLAVAVFVVWKQEYLRPTKEIQLEAGGSQGIKRGLAVRLSGFRIGKVSDVELVAEGRVRVGVDLFREYSRFVRKDSVATLTSESLIGDRFIEISGGSAKAPEIGERESLDLQPEKSLSTMMESLRDEIRPAVIDMRDMIAYMNDPNGDLKVTMRNVRSVADAMGKDLPTILAQARNASEQGAGLFKDLNDQRGDLRGSVAGLLDFINNTKRDIPLLIQELRDAAATFASASESVRVVMVDAGKVVQEVDSMVKKSAPEVPKLVHQGTDTIKKADDVVSAVKGMWPLRRGVPKEGEQLLRADP